MRIGLYNPIREAFFSAPKEIGSILRQNSVGDTISLSNKLSNHSLVQRVEDLIKICKENEINNEIFGKKRELLEHILNGKGDWVGLKPIVEDIKKSNKEYTSKDLMSSLGLDCNNSKLYHQWRTFLELGANKGKEKIKPKPLYVKELVEPLYTKFKLDDPEFLKFNYQELVGTRLVKRFEKLYEDCQHEQKKKLLGYILNGKADIGWEGLRKKVSSNPDYSNQMFIQEFNITDKNLYHTWKNFINIDKNNRNHTHYVKEIALPFLEKFGLSKNPEFLNFDYSELVGDLLIKRLESMIKICEKKGNYNNFPEKTELLDYVLNGKADIGWEGLRKKVISNPDYSNEALMKDLNIDKTHLIKWLNFLNEENSTDYRLIYTKEIITPLLEKFGLSKNPKFLNFNN